MIGCILFYVTGALIGPYFIVSVLTLSLMGALLRVVIPVLLMSRKLAHLPGPPCHRFISGQGEYFRKIVMTGKATIMFDVWLEWSKKYGPLFQYRHYHKHVIPIVHDVDAIKLVLHNVNNKRYVFKDSLQFYNGTRMLGYNGMLLAPYSENWRIKKRILRNFINPRTLATYETEMMQIIDRSLRSVGDGRDVEILSIMQAIATDVMGLCLFNKDFGCSSINGNELSRMCTQIANECFKMIANPMRKLPFTKRSVKRETYRNIIKIRQMARDIIETGSPLTDEFTKVFSDIDDVIDDVNSLLFAGQDTTSNVMAYGLANLAHHDHINKWLREELDSVPSNACWDVINELPRLSAVIKETLRLYPSAPVTIRTLHRDHNVCGHNIPAGSTVWLSPYTAARHPSLWDQPDTFNPQRFIQLKELPKCQYFPFMTGPHECSGKHLVLMEFKLVVFHTIKRFKVELLNETIPPPHMSITLHPSKPIMMRLTSV